jgi:hypothetical protein
MKGEDRMKARTLLLGVLSAALLGALPGWAQDIPLGDDAWDSLGGGASEVTLSSADWKALCGVSVPDTVVQLVGYNIPGLGTADTVVTRLDNAVFGTGSTATVRIQLKTLSFVNDGSHPCSPLTIRVTQDSTQSIGRMTITRTSSAGGTFTAQVPVNAVIQAIDGSGAVKGTTYVSGVLGDDSNAPWAYGTSGATAAQAGIRAHKALSTGGGGTTATTAPWKPGIDPVTQQPARICRIGNKTLPARHCYQPPPPCPVVKSPTPVGAATTKAALATETCTVSATTASSTN